MEVNHESKLNFGTCGYLGLEKHPAILSGAQEYMFKFGMQFSVSRTYIQSTYSITLEETLSKLYDGLPVLTSSSTTLMHAAIIPYLIDKDDVILLDQQCHASMQSSVLQTLSSGTKLDIIRHSDMQMLENKLKIYTSKCTKVWYFADGVYSMFGDVLPINQLNHLLSKYENFNLYVDDAHGMSWAGTNCVYLRRGSICNGLFKYLILQCNNCVV
ncbi:MAG: aminotransferase class I/II-fold pyridoxal phosphate-dependent enzyme [Flavobacteriia bacterium]|jgi:7-keto-8-aminopelargonate synthetase-like enzyme